MQFLLPTLPSLCNVHFSQRNVEVSQNALNLAFTNNAAGPSDRVVANGFAVTSETVGTLGS